MLRDLIKAEIAESGAIPIARYMELALTHPRYGYYTTRDPFGVRGDFTTAPEICQIFGELIGLWCADMWQAQGGGAIQLVELGPGRGTLLADALRATRHVPDFHAHLSVVLVETSPVLQEIQFETLRELHDRLEWTESLEDVPHEPSLFIANEFFDALPIRQHVQTEHGLQERRVGVDAQGELCFVLAQAGLHLAKGSTPIATGTVIESCMVGKQLMGALAQRVSAEGGGALIIDYGYLGEAHYDTLQAVKAHGYTDLLADPGEADITAHVDFASLLSVAKNSQCAAYGPIDQGVFLRRLGAELRLNMLLQHAAPDQAEALVSGLKRLVDPNQMGSLFKAIALAPAHMPPPAGFEEPQTENGYES